MNDKRRIHISKFVSKYLRHEPEKLALTLEPGGWVQIDDLLAGAASVGFSFTREELGEVVEKCDKQRFALDDSRTRIRADQGHSTEVDLGLEVIEPPPELFHGTPIAVLPLIHRDGLLKMARHHVHLSHDIATAMKVGSRRGTPAILVVDSATMRADGHVFFRSANGVWLVEHVPPQYLRVLPTEN